MAFGTEFGQLVIVDTRVEATVQRDHSGPVGWGQRQTDRYRTISSGARSTRQRLTRELGAPAGSRVGHCRSWGVRQPEVVTQYRALVNCIFDVEWTHDDDRIALGCGDSKVRVHDTETHAEVCVYVRTQRVQTNAPKTTLCRKLSLLLGHLNLSSEAARDGSKTQLVYTDVFAYLRCRDFLVFSDGPPFSPLFGARYGPI